MKMRRLFFGLVVLGFLIVLLLGWGLKSGFFGSPSIALNRPAPLPQDPWVKVYMNQNQARGADYTEPYRQITRPGDDLEQIMVEAINQGQRRIDVAIQEFRLPRLAQALAQRRQGGVEVRVILENLYSRPWSTYSAAEIEQLDERQQNRYREFMALADQNQDGQLSVEEINQGDALVILKNAGIPVIDDTADGSRGSGLMHHKFILVDDATVVTGSANFTTSGVHGDFYNPESRGNANNLVRINSEAIANLFRQEFDLMWGDGPGGQPDSLFGLQKPYRPPQRVKVGNSTITVQFSPTSPTRPWTESTNGLIGQTLQQARDSVKLALFVFSEQFITNILEERSQANVSIQALIDPGFAYRYYSEALDMMGVALLHNCQEEANNRPWANPIQTVGIPLLPRGDNLHHKFGVMDAQTVITGSHNWSRAANHTNDEVVLVINNPVVAAHYEREFDRLYSRSNLGLPLFVQERIARAEENCPSPLPGAATPSVGGLVNVNRASQAELETLPGIGPALAGRIIEARQEQPFRSLEDLERVRGIGPVVRQNLVGKVTW
ncbi:helix-hairpin-helix domain-containing protein [Spirulina subsalsa FACHB-351]|uniref:phospholipase D n=1 Tax=Spirulina subsalsa FACHB-351 TaxID=234711 RepID=A0ABT3L8T4_9CYAN|nr:phospholipase D-like domain-containing protein [Spirulina subsalsa]MCW6037923.1 helix-hairpin-helix domain-containing protein [Spirulina subsalsa FACHB-351]